jgi:hypothetical protein
MVLLGLVGAAVASLAFGWTEGREQKVSAAEIALMERARAGQGRAA